MSIAEKQVELSRRLLHISNPKMLNQIEKFLDGNLATLWDEIPDKIKSDFKQSIAQLDAGKFISNEEVFNEANQRWNTKSSGRQKRSKASSK
ncbi:MAG: hypothetical protein SH856_00210 [Flavobacteriales bacterium]|nr:hypothetical protein [Flavobacteriales bacterium]